MTPNCIERLFAHYEILKAISTELTRIVEGAYRPRRREHGIALPYFSQSLFPSEFIDIP